jgi:hypothetical protein
MWPEMRLGLYGYRIAKLSVNTLLLEDQAELGLLL